MPTSTQNIGLLERRIIELLTTTNLTFKEIILKLDSEHLAASIGIIRRINRDNRYRRPRYDSKLTPAQRESLVEELRDHQGVKPNLSLLAKRYGVCHGSVWYWWDKLNRINRCNPHARGPFSTKSLFKRSHQMHLLSSDSMARHQVGLARAKDVVFKQRLPTNTNGGGIIIGHLESGASSSPVLLDGRFNLVGRVGVVASGAMDAIELPILMFSTPSATSENAWPVVSGAAHTAELLADPQLGFTKMFGGGVGGGVGGLHERAARAMPLVKAEV